MSQKAKVITRIASCMLVLASASLCCGEDINQTLLSKLRNEHHQCVVKLVEAYLKCRPVSEQHEFIEELVHLESLITSLSRDMNDFYLGKVSTDNLEFIPAQVLFIYLENKGVSTSVRSFFEGRQFKYFKEEVAGGGLCYR